MDYTKKEHKKFGKSKYNRFILAGDIGGTNCNLGAFGIRDNYPYLLASFRFKSKELKNLYEPINIVLDYFKENYKIKITRACLGIAGALTHKRDYAHLTNAKLHVSLKELKQKTTLKNIFLINDFEAAGYSINILFKKDIKTIKNAAKIPKAPIVVMGAGTGLGKTLLVYDENKDYYKPLPSEAHHSDFAAQTKFEVELVEFIKKHRRIKGNVSNGDILSGNGLEDIYYFLRTKGKFKATKYTKEIDKSKSKPELISNYRKSDNTCKITFEMFKNAYARFVKDCAIDALSYGGVYIAGGIAQKNKDIFDKKFIKIFEESHKMKNVLKKIPLYLILNRDAGLLGAGFAGELI